MFRTDMDALPVTEATGLPYASTVTATNSTGDTVGVMHACGHDIHMTNLIGLATFLAQHKSQWQGTAMLIGQPAEEHALGARAMLDDGLFTRLPKPDYALGLHVATGAPTNVVQVAPGAVFAAVNMVDITCFGRGGHGAYPHATVDPIAQAATLIVDLQSIVSREISPTASAVITVGSIHGGSKHNIIPDSCHLQLTVRNYSEEVRKHLLDAIQRKADAIAVSYRAPKPPLVEVLNEWTPPVINDPQLTRRISQVFVRTVGAENVARLMPQMGGEDFAFYGHAGVPACYFRVGSIAPERHAQMKAAGQPFASAHSALYYPDPGPALRTSLSASVAAMLDLLQADEH
jgi:hippurate hydrolase